MTMYTTTNGGQAAIQQPGAPDRPSQKRVLLISYAFPPVGGAGVQRAVKFVKYLPAQGWSASVLTVSNPSVPTRDESLLSDIPQGTTIGRARTFEPNYSLKCAVSANHGEGRSNILGRLAKHFVRLGANLLLQPDAQVLWAPCALREGKRLLTEQPHDAIMVTAPPFSSFLIGASLSRWSGLPLVLDYRDEWDLSNAYLENKESDFCSRWLQGWMQRRIMRAASALIATTQSSAASLERLRERAKSRASVACIYNGYDPDDLAAERGAKPIARDRYRLSYVGTLWNLTSVYPVVEAVRLLSSRSPELAAKLELAFIGRRTPQQQDMLTSLASLPCRLIEHPYLPHTEALALVRDSDALCVLLSDLPGADRVVPAKIFEYLAARRTILAVAPRGEMWKLLADAPAVHLHTPADIAGIAASLAAEIAKLPQDASPSVSGFDPSRFSRPHEAGQLARLLEAVVAGRQPTQAPTLPDVQAPTPAW